MGGGGSQTVGYKYSLGMHMVLCHGPIDFISSFKVDDRTAWSGFAADTTQLVDAEGLFGGEDREGGVQGYVDIDMGASDQTQNTYLQSQLGSDIPAYRGVVSAVLRKCYLGMNPYLKRWAFRGQRVNTTTDGAEQWYITKAPIGTMTNIAVYIAMDISNSMATDNRLTTLKAGLRNSLAPLLGLPDNSTIDFRVVAFAGGTVSIERTGVNGDDIADIRTWIQDRDYSDVANGTTEYDLAITSATDFFANTTRESKRMIFVTDGAATGGSESDASTIFQALEAAHGDDFKSYAINIHETFTDHVELVDNTPEDGIPIVPSDDTAVMEATLARGLFAHFDLNPAHIIRECLTDTNWGMGYPTTDIDATSFEASADTLYDENMGMSLLWDRQIPIEDFVQEVIRHINAVLYVDPVTGLFTLKLIRDDYDEGTLLTLDDSNIMKVSNYSRTDPGDAVNSVTIVYWDAITGTNASVTADDVALIQQHGVVNNTSIQYPGFTNSTLAAKVAARDLQTLSAPLLNVTIEANREASGLKIGDVFKFEWPDYHDGYVIMRVHQLEFGDGATNVVKITCTEDVFYLPSVAIVGSEESGWVEPGGDAEAITVQSIEEAPYWELVKDLGETTVNGQITDTPEIGFISSAAARPNNGINARVWIDPGSGYAESSSMDFCGYAELAADVDKNATAWTIKNGQDLELVNTGTYAKINAEYFRIDAIDSDAGTMTVGRAVLDTSPREHSEDDAILFVDVYSELSPDEFVDSEEIDVKLRTNASQGVLDLADATAVTVTMNSRAYRPYPPGDLQVDGEAYPSQFIIDGTADLTWTHRDRLQQTAGNLYSHEEPNIGPEAGTTYVVKGHAYGEGGTLIEQDWIDTDVGSATAYEFDPTSHSIPTGTVSVLFEVFSVRDSMESWMAPQQSVIIFSKPSNLSALYAEAAAPESVAAQSTFKDS